MSQKKKKKTQANEVTTLLFFYFFSQNEVELVPSWSYAHNVPTLQLAETNTFYT